MSTVSLEEVKENPGAIFERVQKGESILVVADGAPSVEMRPSEAGPKEQHGIRPFGLCSGAFVVPADFDSPLPEGTILEFEGS
ncbi:MAG: type II toxin-antitoxin system Phd/YefM family antitoxin [Acidobacteria bacterium]|nr:type II toxin-antitoxin system Phd/YefM family antitoxin [Acidobacteriota bacterium]